MASTDPLASNVATLTSLLDLFTGKKTNEVSSGGEETKQTMFSKEAMDALLKGLMEGNSGLATVASGQKTPGLYNSTSRTLMVNDLLARSAAEVAKASAPTVTSRSGGTRSMVTPPVIDPKTGLLIGAGLLAMSPETRKKIGDTLNIKSLSDMFSGVPGYGGVTGSLEGLAADSLGGVPVDYTAGTAVDLAASSIDAYGNIPSVDLTSAWEQAFSGAVPDYAGVSGSIEGLAADGLGGTAVDYAGGAGLAEAGLAGGAETLAAADAMAGIGAVAESAGVEEAIVAAAAAWIICTELNKQHRLPTRWYVHGFKEFSSYDEFGKQGYYVWAIPSTQHLRKYPNSWYSNLMEHVFNHRAEYLAAKAGQRGARKTILGAVYTHGLYWLCWGLARTIARKPQNWQSLYLATGTKG